METLWQSCNQVPSSVVHHCGCWWPVPDHHQPQWWPYAFWTRAPFHGRLFHRNLNSMEISFRSHFDTVIVTKFCTCHDSYAVVSCARICCDLMASNGITERRNFHWIWIVGKKSLVKRAPVPVNDSRFPTPSCWSGRRSVPSPLVARRCPCCRAPDLRSSSRAPRSSCWASIVWNPPEQTLKNFNTLRRCHNERDGVSNHQTHDCLLNLLFKAQIKEKHQSSASLAFVLGIHRWPVNSQHKWPVTRKRFPFDDVIMNWHIDIWTKWLHFHRRHIRLHFHEWKCLLLNCFNFHWKYVLRQWVFYIVFCLKSHWNLFLMVLQQ